MPPTPALGPFERSHFFYGLLMDAERCQRDHAFFNEKRWMLNRLVLGSGVVCGLDVKPASGGLVSIEPGVAVDPAGREIVVPESRPVDPHQPTDDQGRPAGGLLASGVVEVRLSYSEVKTDLVPVLVPDCDGPGDCAPSTIREAFAVVVRPAAGPASAPPGCSLASFPVPPEPGLHDLLAQRLRQACPTPAPDVSVPIARVDLGTSAIDTVAGRPLVYGNRLLYELLVCLAQRVSNAGTRFLRYVSGDNQSGPAAAALGQPLVVELVDALDVPLAGEVVQFSVASGGGTVAAATVTTGPDGRASTSWTLGPAPGAQEVTAGAVATVFTVSFKATGV